MKMLLALYLTIDGEEKAEHIMDVCTEQLDRIEGVEAVAAVLAPYCCTHEQADEFRNAAHELEQLLAEAEKKH